MPDVIIGTCPNCKGDIPAVVQVVNKIGVCPKCFKIGKLTEHHIFPKRFFGNKNNDSKLFLCWNCHHKGIEKLLPLEVKLTKEQYIEIHKAWLNGDNPLVIPKGAKKGRREKYVYNVREPTAAYAR